MSDIVIVIERKRFDQEHWIKPAPRTGNTEQQYRVFFEGEEIGSWRVPEHEAARWLLAQGKAQRSDTLRTRLRVDGVETPSMRGNVGWFADYTVNESDSKGGAPRLVRWQPMPEGVKTGTGKGEDGLVG
jgi:hypothetical protein